MEPKMKIPNAENVSNYYRPIPFWSWNERLDTKETARQVKLMSEAGIGGFFMHARGGLITEYLSREWFDNVTAAKEEAEKQGMYAWAYDENGWPSGFGAGKVSGKGVDYQQKYLRFEDKPLHKDTAIAKCGSHYFYYEINPFYVDNLDKKVVKEFIKTAYLPYYERYGNSFAGFFTDEPQLSRNGLPWSFVLEDEYKKRYGEDLCEHLEELFFRVGDWRKTRIKYWKLVTDLFSDSYFKTVHDWCSEHGLRFTGHLILEERLSCQITANGACMPHYEYFDMPGMDWLGRNISPCLTPYQVSSVAEQLGIDDVLSETFALCGQGVSFAELKGLYEWQAVHGINRLCQHLEGYSIRGIRKRDYPPAMYCQQPWWKEYKGLVDALSRESMLLSKGKKSANVLLIHLTTDGWVYYEGADTKEIKELDLKLLDNISALERKHIKFHLGDETVMERHARVEGKEIVIGNQRYDKVILPGEYLLDSTKALLDEYLKNGGEIVTAEQLPENKVTDREDISYTSREYEGGTLHYFVNTSNERREAKIFIKGKKLNIYSGKWEPFSGSHSFEPWGSLMIVENQSETVAEADTYNVIELGGKYKPDEKTLNALTLDRCDYYFDGELIEKDGYILNICERANKSERPVHIKMKYKVKASYIPKALYFLGETPEQFSIRVNGREIKDFEGYMFDSSIRKCDIKDFLVIGENDITLETDFYQSKEFYENLKNSYKFESEKNKLTYIREIEAAYLVGEFSLDMPGKFEYLPNDAVRYTGDFIIAEPKKEIDIKKIVEEGYPFFCGEMKLSGRVTLSGRDDMLVFDRKGVNAIRVEIGDMNEAVLTDDRIKVKGSGETEIKLTLTNNLRNLLGPHHIEAGECFAVGPDSYYKEKCVWNAWMEKPVPFNEGYCFIRFGI